MNNLCITNHITQHLGSRKDFIGLYESGVLPQTLFKRLLPQFPVNIYEDLAGEYIERYVTVTVYTFLFHLLTLCESVSIMNSKTNPKYKFGVLFTNNIGETFFLDWCLYGFGYLKTTWHESFAEKVEKIQTSPYYRYIPTQQRFIGYSPTGQTISKDSLNLSWDIPRDMDIVTDSFIGIRVRQPGCRIRRIE